MGARKPDAFLHSLLKFSLDYKLLQIRYLYFLGFHPQIMWKMLGIFNKVVHKNTHTHTHSQTILLAKWMQSLGRFASGHKPQYTMPIKVVVTQREKERESLQP